MAGVQKSVILADSSKQMQSFRGVQVIPEESVTLCSNTSDCEVQDGAG